MNSPIIEYMPYIMGGGVLLLALIVVPLAIRARNKGKRKAEQFQKDFDQMVAQRGLEKTQKGARGEYGGYYIEFETRMGSNRALQRDIATETAYEAVTGDEHFGRADYGGHHNMYYPTLHVRVDSPYGFPDVALIEPNNYLKNSDEWRNKGNTTKGWNKMEISAKPLYKKAKFYGSDSDAAQKLLSSSELRQLLGSWAYPDIRAEDNTLRLALDNNNIVSKWGWKRIRKPDYIFQGIDIAIAAAKALDN